MNRWFHWYHQEMTIKNVVGRVLKLSQEEHARRRRMRDGWKGYREFMKSLPYMGDSTPLIREGREHSYRNE
jgi:hypothetical protein